jgi:hypothetical protein
MILVCYLPVAAVLATSSTSLRSDTTQSYGREQSCHHARPWPALDM